MEGALLTKLRQVLSEDVESEERVVYILVEIRKLIKLTDTEGKYRSLAFYCSWAVHIEMSFAEAQKLLRHFDEAYPLMVGGQDLHELPPTLGGYVQEIIRLDHLRDNLRDFFLEHGLPDRLLKDQWVHFMHQYALVIEDCPLVIKAGSGSTSNIDKVVVTHDMAHTLIDCGDHQEQWFRVNWRSYGKDGKTGVIFVMSGMPVPPSVA